jgi:ribosome recycling factor
MSEKQETYFERLERLDREAKEHRASLILKLGNIIPDFEDDIRALDQLMNAHSNNRENYLVIADNIVALERRPDLIKHLKDKMEESRFRLRVSLRTMLSALEDKY